MALNRLKLTNIKTNMVYLEKSKEGSTINTIDIA